LQGRRLYTYAEALSNEEAQNKATRFLQSMSRNIQYLKKQCSVNGSTILKRWKKSSKKRNSYLVSVDPDAYPHEWCNAHFLKDFYEKKTASNSTGEVDVDLSQGSVRLDFRNVCLLPYINLESLTNEPAKFLNLLHNRIRYSPEQWPPYDNFLLVKQWEIGALKTGYNPNCLIMHGPNYGDLTPWNKQRSHSWVIIGFPRAILVLEAQGKLLCFLRGLVEKLVEGVEGEDGTDKSDTFGRALDLGLKISNATSGGVEFASAYLNQSFCAPQVFDVRKLLSIPSFN
jgi:hypothetical protein